MQNSWKKYYSQNFYKIDNVYRLEKLPPVEEIIWEELLREAKVRGTKIDIE